MANPIAGISHYWYEAKKDVVHTKLYPYVQHLQQENSGHVQEMLRNFRLYYGRQVTSFSPYSYHRNSDTIPAEGSSRNLIASGIDTVVSKVVGTSRPAVEFVTTAGNWKEQRQARLLTRFLDGIFYSTKVYELGPQIVRDACWAGDGWVYVYEEAGKVEIERVWPLEIFFDLAEAIHGKQRQLFRCQQITRDKLLQLFPKKTKEIRAAQPIKAGGTVGANDYADDLIEVFTAYRLPSFEGAGDGHRAVILQNATLAFDEYERMRFPYVNYQYCRPLLGPYGISVATMGVRSQVYTNRLLKIIDRSLACLSAPKIWMGPGAGENSDHYTREIGGVLRGATKPEILAQQILPPETYQHLADVQENFFKMLGISEQAAAAVKPAGVTAAVAIESLNDIQSGRLAVPSLAYEDFFPAVSEVAIDVMKDIYDAKKHYVVKYPSKDGLAELDWDEIQPEEDTYVLKVNAVANLMKTVPGKLQYIDTLQSLGVIAPFQVPRLMNNPDLDAFLDPLQAMQDWIYKKIDKILDDGAEGFSAPDPMEDMTLSLQLFTQAYAKAVYDEAPQDRVRLLRQYIVQLRDKMAPPPAPGPAAGPPMPGAPPPGAPPGPSMAPAAPLPATLHS